jgi:phosphatidate cytidylyltransferase
MNEHDNSTEGEAAPRGWAERLGNDFTVRLVAGLAMAVVALAFTVAGVIPFAVMVVLVALVVSWEWGRLVHGDQAGPVIAVQMVTSALAGTLAAAGLVGLGLLALPIGAILATLLTLGRNSVFSALGVFYPGLPAVALIWLRSDASLGLAAVIFLVVVVVTADTASFVAGRLLGQAKLWPSVSPNKTWAGLIGAVIASAIVASLFWLALPDASLAWLATAGAVLALVAQAGDLAESALKRRFGAKDAGALIPGHGGVMDRVDGLVAAASVVGIAAVAIDVHSPARALLLGS